MRISQMVSKREEPALLHGFMVIRSFSSEQLGDAIDFLVEVIEVYRQADAAGADRRDHVRLAKPRQRLVGIGDLDGDDRRAMGGRERLKSADVRGKRLVQPA